MHCSGVTVFKSEGFVASSMNSDLYFLFSIGFKSDDCLAILAALFSFSENQSESFFVLFWDHLHHPGTARCWD